MLTDGSPVRLGAVFADALQEATYESVAGVLKRGDLMMLGCTCCRWLRGKVSRSVLFDFSCCWLG